MSLSSLLIKFLSDANNRTLSHARTSLMALRNVPIDGFTLPQSRSLWYSVILYHFRNDTIPDVLWTTAREFILAALRGQDVRPIATAYLDLFDTWKENDLNSLVHEMASCYFTLIEIKDAIERLPPQTISAWRDSYVGLMTKIRHAAKKIQCEEKMDQVVADMKRTKAQYMYDMMHRAYWDMLEEELKDDKTAILLCQMNEMRTLFHAIHPQDELQPVFDTAYRAIEDGSFTTDDAWNLFVWCMQWLRQWDSAEFERTYDDTLASLQPMVDQESRARTIRTLMEKSTVLALDLKLRKDIWKLLLSIPGGDRSPHERS